MNSMETQKESLEEKEIDKFGIYFRVLRRCDEKGEKGEIASRIKRKENIANEKVLEALEYLTKYNLIREELIGQWGRGMSKKYIITQSGKECIKNGFLNFLKIYKGYDLENLNDYPWIRI